MMGYGLRLWLHVGARGGVVGDVLSGAKSLVDRNLISGERMF